MDRKENGLALARPMPAAVGPGTPPSCCERLNAGLRQRGVVRKPLWLAADP